MDKATRMVSGIRGLSSLPAVYQQVKGVLDDPDSSIQDLSNVVSADVAITVRLLQVVNSVYFGLTSRIDTASRAVNVLGMQQVHDIVLSTSISSLFDGMNPANMNMSRFWSNSVMRALIARSSAEMVRAGDLERYFVAGLLADLGHLVLYLAEPGAAERAQIEHEAGGRLLHELERLYTGCDYAEVGAALMREWGLPPRLASVIGGQIEPSGVEEAFRRDAALLCLARVMTDAMERGLDCDQIAILVEPDVWMLTGLTPANISTIRLLAEMNHGEVLALFFPQLRAAS